MIRMNPFGILDELLGNGWMTDFGAKSEFGQAYGMMDLNCRDKCGSTYVWDVIK
jgi:hypothetical protein